MNLFFENSTRTRTTFEAAATEPGSAQSRRKFKTFFND